MSVEFYRHRVHRLLELKARIRDDSLVQEGAFGYIVKWDSTPMKVYIKKEMHLAAEIVVNFVFLLNLRYCLEVSQTYHTGSKDYFVYYRLLGHT